MVINPTSWNEMDISTLRLMWVAGCSAAVIATALHRTRSAVCGKINRLKLNSADRTGSIIAKEPKQKKAPSVAPKASPMQHEPITKFSPVESAAKPVPFLEVKSFHCRAVLDQRGEDGLAMFCGAKKLKGSSWCPKHHRLFVNYGRA